MVLFSNPILRNPFGKICEWLTQFPLSFGKGLGVKVLFCLKLPPPLTSRGREETTFLSTNLLWLLLTSNILPFLLQTWTEGVHTVADKPFLTDVKTLRERARQHIERGAVTEGYKPTVRR